jgi:hypothetical protein
VSASKTEPGHVFVVHGDLLTLACDAVLVPIDGSLDVSLHWMRWVPENEERKASHWEHNRVTEPAWV